MYAKWTNRWVPAASALLLLSALFAGCGNEGDDRPGGGFQGVGGDPGFGGAPPSLGACDEDAEPKECTIYIHQANGVTSCFSGMQFCDEGSWSDCLPADEVPSSQ